MQTSTADSVSDLMTNTILCWRSEHKLRRARTVIKDAAHWGGQTRPLVIGCSPEQSFVTAGPASPAAVHAEMSSADKRRQLCQNSRHMCPVSSSAASAV